MANYLKIESSLAKLGGFDIASSPFYNSAGEFESILKDNSLTADQKAEQIAEIIERGINKK